MRRYARFVTEDNEQLLVSLDIEVINHLTGQFIPAADATPDEAVLVRSPQEKLAMRCPQDFKNHQKRRTL